MKNVLIAFKISISCQLCNLRYILIHFGRFFLLGHPLRFPSVVCVFFFVSPDSMRRARANDIGYRNHTFASHTVMAHISI